MWLNLLTLFIALTPHPAVTSRRIHDVEQSGKSGQITGEIAGSAAKFDRIRRAHQSEVAEDYVEMISDLIAETGEARAVDLAARLV